MKISRPSDENTFTNELISLDSATVKIPSYFNITNGCKRKKKDLILQFDNKTKVSPKKLYIQNEMWANQSDI